MANYSQPDYGRIRRVAKRAHYDKATVHDVLDAAYVAHVGFSVDGRPFVIPMLHARAGRTIYLHASTKSRFYRQLSEGIAVCLTATHLDGLVLARSAFHHSMNYRSVVVHGTCRPVAAAERAAVLQLFTNKLIPGRWEECRPIKDKEVAVTGVLALQIESAAAKIRTGGPSDEAEDYALPIWAGVIPLQTVLGTPQADPAMTTSQPIPESVKQLLAKV